MAYKNDHILQSKSHQLKPGRPEIMTTTLPTGLLCLAGICMLLLVPVETASKPSPILLFPGVGRSQLQGRNNNWLTTVNAQMSESLNEKLDTLTTVTHQEDAQSAGFGSILIKIAKEIVKDPLNAICYTFKKYKDLWYGLFRTSNCVQDLELRYDKENPASHYRNSSGIKIRVPGFGQTWPVEYISSFKSGETKYMKDLVDYFVGLGYERDKTIRAAPYDWRLAADELDKRGYFNDVKKLVEEMKNKSQEKVTLVAHSMGGLVSHYFLTKMTDQWKNTYIHAWVTLGTPWTGSVETLHAITSNVDNRPTSCGISSSIRKIDCTRWSVLVPYCRSFESFVWLLPKSSEWGETVLVETESNDYTAGDYKALFDRIDYKNGWDMLQGIQDLRQNIAWPNVQTHCLYGYNVDTKEKLEYKLSDSSYKWPLPDKLIKKLIDPIKQEKPDITYGNGDGLVNLKSLEHCKEYFGGKKGFKSEKYDSVDHSAILSNKEVLDDIAEIVGAKQTSSSEQLLNQLLKLLMD